MTTWLHGNNQLVPYTTAPRRIQRRRTKGWRMPETAIYVGRGGGRPSKWANPFKVVANGDGTAFITNLFAGGRLEDVGEVKIGDAREMAVGLFRKHITAKIDAGEVDITELAGKDLVCWCAPDSPCHADVLLELANTPRSGFHQTMYEAPAVIDNPEHTEAVEVVMDTAWRQRMGGAGWRKCSGGWENINTGRFASDAEVEPLKYRGETPRPF